MKKSFRLLVLILMINALMAITCLANTPQMTVYVDNEKVVFTEATGYPFVDQTGSTLMPLRAVLEKMGAKVQWQNNAALITKGSQVVEVPLGYAYILHNDKKISTTTSARMKNNKLYIPLRAVVTTLGGNITLPNNTTIKITAQFSSPNGSSIALPTSDVAHALQKRISTKEDALSYLDQTFDTLWHSYHLWQGANSNTAALRSGIEILDNLSLGNAEIGRAHV